MSARPELQKGPEQQKEFKEYSETILQTSANRSKRTRELLSELIPGLDPDEFVKNAVNEANNVKPGIKIEAPKPGEYLTKAVLELQYKFLGFPKTDDPSGCDGKLGQYTLSKLKESLPLLNKYITGKEKKLTSIKSSLAGLRSTVSVSTETQTKAAPQESSNYKPDTDKQELIDRGSTPFPVRVGYQLTPDEASWYREQSRWSHSLVRKNIHERLKILNDRYKLMEGIEKSARMLGISEENMKIFIAYNDAVMRVESSYNVFDVNLTKNNRIHLSDAAGEYQIINMTYQETKRKWLQQKKDTPLMRRLGINMNEISDVSYDAPRAELLTPYQRAIFHNFYAFMASRLRVGGSIPIDSIFDKIRSTGGAMQDSWIKLMYTYWRNGHGGAKPFVRNIEQNIPFPESREQAMEYYEKHLNKNDWQYKRGFNDFYTLVRACNVYASQFKKNMREL